MKTKQTIVATARTFVPNRKPEIVFQIAHRCANTIRWHKVTEETYNLATKAI